MIIKQFKARASSMGKLMTNGRGKGAGMGLTAKTEIRKWYWQQLTGKRPEITSKYTQKGNIMEAEAITLYEEIFGGFDLTKNEQYFKDEYFTGTPDLILPDRIVDVKCVWSQDTLPIDGSYNSDYEDQAQVYMHLTGRRDFTLFYALMDAPEHIIFSTARAKSIEAGEEEVDMEIYDQVKANMTYSDLPVHMRYVAFHFEYDPERIEQFQQRVTEARQHIADKVEPMFTGWMQSNLRRG